MWKICGRVDIGLGHVRKWGVVGILWVGTGIFKFGEKVLFLLVLNLG